MSGLSAEHSYSARGQAQAHERRLGGRDAAPGDETWALEPHICRACFGRLVSRPADAPGWRRYQCTNCGLEASAQAAAEVCCCGTKLRKATPSGRSGAALIDAGIRCMSNPAPTPDFPSVIVAGEVSSGQ
jgi:hypothetical protein